MSRLLSHDINKWKEIAAVQVREQRDDLLTKCDWTQIPDCTVDKESWKRYRQELRDITKQDGFPLEVIWPIKP